MATDGPDPPPCDRRLFSEGVCVGVFEVYGSNHFEELIGQVRRDCRKPVDWHMAGGRARVVTFKNYARRVRRSVEAIVRPAIEARRAEAMAEVNASLFAQRVLNKASPVAR